MPTTPGSAPSVSTSALLAARAAARVGTAPSCTACARGASPASAAEPLRAELPQHGGERVGERDPRAGAPALGAPGEQQRHGRAVPAAPDHRPAVAPGAEGPDVALDLDLVVEAVHRTVV